MTLSSGRLEQTERVAIVGPGGAGKSTFARSLGEHTGLPVFHLDRFFWKPGWIETPREEWRQRQSELVAADGSRMETTAGRSTNGSLAPTR